MKNNKVTIVMYHYVRNLTCSRYPHINGLDFSYFKEQLSFFAKHYTFVSVEQIIAASEGLEALPPHSILLTFDDAYADHFTYVFPVLARLKINGAFYVPIKAVTEHYVLDVNKIHFILASIAGTGISSLILDIKKTIEKYTEEFNLNTFQYYYNKLAIANRFDNKDVVFVKRLLQKELNERLRKIIVDKLFMDFVGIEEEVFSKELYMHVDQLKYMLECGMHIGCHGFNHYWLGSLPKEQQRLEIEKSLTFLSDLGCDMNNWTICYPYGNYNSDTLSLLLENKCKLGLTTNVDVALLSSNVISNLSLPRLDTNDFPKNANADINKWYY